MQNSAITITVETAEKEVLYKSVIPSEYNKSLTSQVCYTVNMVIDSFCANNESVVKTNATDLFDSRNKVETIPEELKGNG